MNPVDPTRRLALAGIGATLLSGRASAFAADPPPDLSSLEDRLGSGARIGVLAQDLSRSRRIAWRADERFAMCSTFKWLLAAQILAEAEAGSLLMSDTVTFQQHDLVPYSPVTGPLAVEGVTSIATLCSAAVSKSDNTAANLLLRLIGGPRRFTGRLRDWRDGVTRLDRWETDLNENLPGDPRDTTSPAAMADLLRRILFGDTLSGDSRKLLMAWMESADTGLTRLRAALPAGWTAGDKTGTSNNGANNDVAFFRRPSGAPIVIASYINAPQSDRSTINAVHAEIGTLIIDMFRT